MRFQVVSFGHKLVSTKWTRSAQAASDARPAFSRIANYLMETTQTQFESQGRRGGGSWKRLTPRWLFRKTSAGHDPRILHMSGALRRSVTKRRARGQVLIIEPRSLTFGTKLDHAARHQFGHAQTPKRQFIRVTARDRQRMRNEVRNHLMKPWGRGGAMRA